jgi:hypothetical protein
MTMNDEDPWPPLPLEGWRPTYETLHLWMQIVGKIRLELTPRLNHWWNSTLYLTARGMTTSPMPYRDGSIEIRFDFIDHKLVIDTSWGATGGFDLGPQACADFYERLHAEMTRLGIEVKIWPVTCELPELIRLDQDRTHRSYDAGMVHRWWRATLSATMVLEEFRAKFVGKSSPVHFFWGSFDLAVTRFNGKRAPAREGADSITREAYSHEVISAGFWPGSGPVTDAAFYAYAAPSPEGLSDAKVRPDAAHWDAQLGEFILMYDAVRNAPSPRVALMEFLESTYEAAASLASWNREELERKH